MTSLKGADGQVYALAQGALILGGYNVGNRASNLKTTNHAGPSPAFLVVPVTWSVIPP